MRKLVNARILENFGKKLKPEKLFNELKPGMVPGIRKELKGQFEVKDDSQLTIGEFSQAGYGTERDGNVYPIIRLDVHVTSLDGTQSADFVYSVGLFDCCLYTAENEFCDAGTRDLTLTKVHRRLMREKYGAENYNKLLASYVYRVRQKEKVETVTTK